MAETEPDTQKYIVPGLQRGLQILRAFDRDRTQIGAPEIAKELNIPRSTVFRLMQTLEFMGFVEKVDHSSDYRLSIGVLSLGFEFLASLEVTELARPILDTLRDETGFSAHLAIRDGTDVVFVVKSAARTAFASTVNIGTRLPAHGTVLGRMILADLTQDELSQVYTAAQLAIFSDQTPATRDNLEKMLVDDKARGYALSEAYYEHGIAAIAAPVRDGTGRVIAAINVTFANGSVDRTQMEKTYVAPVLDAAHELSRRLNYRPAGATTGMRQAG
jgi:DNA-binding IclR family transcriptional regulator